MSVSASPTGAAPKELAQQELAQAGTDELCKMLRERPNEAQISAPLRLRHLRRARSLRTSPYTRIPAKIHSKARSFLSCHVSRAVRVSPHPCEGSSSLSGRAALDANAAKEAGIHSYSQTSEPSALALTTAVANNLNEPGAPLATIPPSHGPLTAHASISPEATPKQATDPARSGSSAIRTRNETLKQTRALVRAGLQEALQDIVAQLLVIDGQKQANETSSATSKSASLCPHLSRQRSITVGENCAVTDLAAELDPSPESSDEDSQLEPMDSDEDEFSRKICGTGVEGVRKQLWTFVLLSSTDECSQS
ncbi:hypothetical protein K437DRAFT_127111 [Tilletiaria anomala UBC 951]|uniref:Uncharacterized protein n=1 Tax=Tilletiaria anomala (strain ATCC 24038 / CBS 436.72 / UBC 951) TaxID=1037660 RepID=A0A066W1J3_TILAU|nr:uncharacterized protein K437DRAFT_127111 [Tilletiaria anomala UBC 951]KDN44929.1 hypothetical protein K437DRAFT_127111 [Tilletiaria anomala UBC 951]